MRGKRERKKDAGPSDVELIKAAIAQVQAEREMLLASKPGPRSWRGAWLALERRNDLSRRSKLVQGLLESERFSKRKSTWTKSADGWRGRWLRQLTTVDTTLDGGADANKATTDDSLSCMPLCIAARDGHVELMRLLLAGGADVNKATTGNGGSTPLYIAAQDGHVEVTPVPLVGGAERARRLKTTVAHRCSS
jgi:hypothetical protein